MSGGLQQESSTMLHEPFFRESRRYLLEREMRNVSSLAGVLDGNAANVTIAIEIKQGVLIQILGFTDLSRLEFNIKRVRVLEILDFHDLNRQGASHALSITWAASTPAGIFQDGEWILQPDQHRGRASTNGVSAAIRH